VHVGATDPKLVPGLMDERMIISIPRMVAFIGSALLAAALLAEFAHNDLGFSRHSIRSDALTFALGIVGVLILFLCSDRFGKKR
jgi:hypothetical protein